LFPCAKQIIKAKLGLGRACRRADVWGNQPVGPGLLQNLYLTTRLQQSLLFRLMHTRKSYEIGSCTCSPLNRTISVTRRQTRMRFKKRLEQRRNRAGL